MCEGGGGVRGRGRKGEVGGGFDQLYSCEASPMISMQLQVRNICSVHIGVFYLLCKTSMLNTHNRKHCDEIKERNQRRSEAKTQENHKQDHNEPDHRY